MTETPRTELYAERPLDIDLEMLTAADLKLLAECLDGWRTLCAALETESGERYDKYLALSRTVAGQEATIADMQRAMDAALRQLINVQTHIAELGRMRPFIDSHVDVAIQHLRAGGAQ